MGRPSAPPAWPDVSSPTPDTTRNVEESRLRSKKLRSQRDALARASGQEPGSAVPRSPSGFIDTKDVNVVSGRGGRAPRKRPYQSISSSEGPLTPAPANDRDGSKGACRDGSCDVLDSGALRPINRKFAKYVDYNFSAMTDTKGGFLSADDDLWDKSGASTTTKGDGEGQAGQRPKHLTAAEWERLQLLRKLQRQKAGPFEPGLSTIGGKETRKKCRECGSLEIDWVWEEVFGCCICNSCKEKYPEKYSLLTKTECKEDYLITDPELKDKELLPHLSRPNPHKTHWHDMMLFLRYQVEEYAFKTKWGSADALDVEFERREANKKRRKEEKFREKLLDLKKKTRADAYRRVTGSLGGGSAKFGEDLVTSGLTGKHVHEWGRAIQNEDGMSIKTCSSCGMEVEELEF